MRIGSAPMAVTRIRRTGPIVADEVAFSLRHAKATVKATLPAPSYLHYPRGRGCVDPDVYPELDQFFADVVAVYVAELKALHAAGGRYLQIDEVAQTLLCDQRLRDAVKARGDDPERLVDLYIDLINRVVRERPAGLTVGIHMCRGNAHGKWVGAGGYERIAEKSFSRLEVDAFFLEFDSERAGGFEPLRFIPKGKKVVIGAVSTKSPVL
jgi:5-methyltetrahydropteroyltriglutamate--homocysteine methyltransferase